MYQIAASVLKNVVVILLSQIAYASIEKAINRRQEKTATAGESSAQKAVV
jgi:hypothetical protein